MLETLTNKTEFAIVEQIRGEIRRLDFAPIAGVDLDDMARRRAFATANNAIEGLHETDEEAALHTMLQQERAPSDVRDYAVRRLLEHRLGRHLSGQIFPECPY